MYDILFCVYLFIVHKIRLYDYVRMICVAYYISTRTVIHCLCYIIYCFIYHCLV